ncbi:Prophage Clp protease-like protein [Rhodovulum sp. PH10]|uniref:head maturation protease, ClpP-related n=1 Tax=Rhodovulum sp. PH10 TaxID=1187851 RepID=UPI00027C24B4|nr:head maturation protease, ClpP-related [Rhodovulum sp. PH10]EJW12742.1 Prophage Clp protease-like protein [Rhodovulum sp. PH10]
MSLRKLPEATTPARPKNFQWDAPSDVLARWSKRPLTAESDDPATISLYEPIGEDAWGSGWTARRMAGALRSIGAKDVTVKINSPGGDMFESVAIYNLLREHPARVIVDVMGIAASGASIITMAADTIRVGLGSFVMIHNAWGLVIGNRHDFRDAAGVFEGFDTAMVDIYAARTGRDRKAIETLMDAETYMGASAAIEAGVADELNEGVSADEPSASARETGAPMARRRLDAILAQQGIPRSERRRLLREAMAGTPSAAGTVMPSAGLDLAMVRDLITILKS